MLKYFDRSFVRVLTVAIALAVAMPAGAQMRLRAVMDSRPAPYAVDLTQVQFEIVGWQWVTNLRGVNAEFRETQTDQFRGAVVTVQVTKPEGESLTLSAADFALHYARRTDGDVVPCYGLSTFSTSADAERLMRLAQVAVTKTTTGPAATRARTVFVDVFFQYIEDDADVFYLAVAAPATAAYVTAPWGRPTASRVVSR